MDKTAKLGHLRLASLRAKALIGDVAKAAADAITEVERSKADLAVFQTEILDPGRWAANTDKDTSSAGYAFRYTLEVQNAAAKDSAECIIVPADIQEASGCGLCPTTDVAAGQVVLYAASAPKTSITIQVRLIRGAV